MPRAMMSGDVRRHRHLAHVDERDHAAAGPGSGTRLRSKRPGRVAPSSVEAVVAAMTITPALPRSRPSDGSCSARSRSSLPPKAGAALATDRVDLIDEHDARRVLLRLLNMSRMCSTDADEHLDEVGAGDRKERHLRFAGDRLREQRLAVPGKTIGTPRGAAARLESRIAEFDEPATLLRFIAAGDIGEREVLFDRRASALFRSWRTTPRPASGMKKIHTPISSSIGNHEMKICAGALPSPDAPRPDAVDEVADHPDVAGAVRDVALLVRRQPFDRPALDGGGFDAAAARRFHEIGIRDGILCRLP